ncbi:aminotransferase class I/II-fold pyridoxal phosphate-dependent enzyme [Nonomuraea gerenzanensis]|uniref:Arginine decarboxylase Ornithine decarboxylase Lysine decarboxylase n=1 Tax=Nonomuraea gerenzanensis TaxID=93944 RepID=A0A1M4EM05_9ACTN|nr:ornithine decarboxylase [Nonomuraea gerenzanensis]UBU11389.1 ornithine decarboxylase [Nonomuraea gerenzanensis]SBO99872.1 Arginine decarboxylase; Ornithine decarboxylase; Lysine decarboxylase [Nonomuraea gerenzanensis]
MDHSQAPILQALQDYHDSGQLPFTPPGHKQARGVDPRVAAVLGEEVFRSDVLSVGGLDDRSSSGGFLEQAEKLMADAVGAAQTFFSTCGSSLSVKASMLSVAGPHEKLLIGRDAHKSVVAGLVLAGIDPVWVEPQWDEDLHLAHPPSPEAFAAAFAEHPDAKGALVVTPTPYGTCTDLAALARVCHEHGKPLIVDEAWGAHLPFHPDLPTWAMDAGADVCVTSIHKMGSGLEQSSVFHLQGDLIAPELLKERADLFSTTSPSVLVYAALDGWRRQMVEHGHAIYDRTLQLAKSVRASIEAIDGLHVHGRDDFCGHGRAFDADPLQLMVDVSGLGTGGYQVADRLRERHRINVGLADHRRIGVQLTHADDEDTTGRLLEALRELAGHAGELPPAPRLRIPPPAELRLEQAMLPRDAFFGPAEHVPWREAAGRIAAELITPYPPGIPAALPGERLNMEVLDYLHDGRSGGMVVPDAADASLETVRVVA